MELSLFESPCIALQRNDLDLMSNEKILDGDKSTCIGPGYAALAIKFPSIRNESTDVNITTKGTMSCDKGLLVTSTLFSPGTIFHENIPVESQPVFCHYEFDGAIPFDVIYVLAQKYMEADMDIALCEVKVGW